ncbi:hypothetical protein GGQ68_004585 [Sagittula marina]|uniref:Uncharacterized protein n=1 Tax=Sagittula marina TaxID=943940 RepID=A0A7W6DZK0_9RHOB|nr:hypothetical protein [Sagittula marina]MBB3988229.1 hypothetical protein [Sagittula marina]
MPRWMWWVLLGLFVLVGALMFFRLGFIDAHLTESDAIAHYAERYARQSGGLVSDCTATPGETTWLHLRCVRGIEVREYGINRFGGLVSERTSIRP